MAGSQKTCRVCGAAYASGELFCPADGTRLAAPGDVSSSDASDPLIGDTLSDRYRMLRVIGEGGMGIVYEAEHLEIGKRVAVKVLRADFTKRPDVVERFRREARGASRLGHPNIVTVTDFGETRTGANYFVMELLEGEDLADMLSRDGAVAPTRAAEIGFQCCQALETAHAQGIVHRDMKPENMFLVRQADGRELVKVVDFGVAKVSDMEMTAEPGRRLTKTGMVFGTPEYMSPEQARGMELDERVDVYALGVMMYELVTGRVPFEGDNFMELLNKHASSPVPPLFEVNPNARISDQFARVIFRALHKDREFRYASMTAMAHDLLLADELAYRRTDDAEKPPAWSLRPPPSLPVRVQPAAASKPTRPSAWESVAHPTRSQAALAMIGLATAMLAIAAWWPQRGPSRPVATRVAPIHVTTEVDGVSARNRRGAVTVPAAAMPAGALPESQVPIDEDMSEVIVDSRPSGGKVHVSGIGDVCPKTPCTVRLVRNKTVRVTVRSANARGTARVRPSRAQERVHVVLKERASEASDFATTTTSALKVPEAFK